MSRPSWASPAPSARCSWTRWSRTCPPRDEALPSISPGGSPPSRIFASETLHDLDALIAQLEREAEAGTRTGWEADEAHTRGGWPTIWRDERAASLSASAAELRRFRMSMTAILDALEAERVAHRLMDME